MRQLTYLNEWGDFTLRCAQRYGEIYFPLVNAGGMMSSVTPLLAGDCKTGQNTFLLAPASEDSLRSGRDSRNFWVRVNGGEPWSVTGQSAPQQARRFDPDCEETVLTGGLLWQRLTRESRALGLRAPTLTFDERGHQPGRVTYQVWGGDETGAPPQGFLALARDFVGEGSWDWPEAVVRPRPDTWLHAGQSAQGGEMAAALFFPTVTLGPGESRRYQIILAIGANPAPYLTPDGVEAALEQTKAWWQGQVGQVFRTGDARFDAWMRWVAIQPVLRRICGCSFLPHHDYGRGGRGWRDLWQDSLALLLTDPSGVREDLLSYFGGVRADGTNATIIGAAPGEFKADRNGIPRVWMDHGFWPLLTVALYLDETGDDGFLLEERPYFADDLPWRGEWARSAPPDGPRAGTVLEHLLVQLAAAFFDVGEHGHMRLRGADWNDGLDMARERGESVAFTAASEWVGDGVRLHWFNSYYDNSGRQAEGLRGETARMMLTGQVFAILSGAADDGRVREIVRAADWYLFQPQRGGYCLNTDFGEVKLDMGRMFGFAYGHKENGAVFSHMAVMYAYALYARGFAAEGWKVLWQLFLQSDDFSRGRLLPGIPEYFDDRGRGMYPYLTGAGSWLLLTMQTQVFGVRGRGGDLLLEPKLRLEQFDADGAAELCCTAAGRRLRVRYENDEGLDFGQYRLGTVTCGEKRWTGSGGRLVIPRGELPEGDGLLELTAKLISAGEGEN